MRAWSSGWIVCRHHSTRAVSALIGWPNCVRRPSFHQTVSVVKSQSQTASCVARPKKARRSSLWRTISRSWPRRPATSFSYSSTMRRRRSCSAREASPAGRGCPPGGGRGTFGHSCAETAQPESASIMVGLPLPPASTIGRRTCGVHAALVPPATLRGYTSGFTGGGAASARPPAAPPGVRQQDQVARNAPPAPLAELAVPGAPSAPL